MSALGVRDCRHVATLAEQGRLERISTRPLIQPARKPATVDDSLSVFFETTAAVNNGTEPTAADKRIVGRKQIKHLRVQSKNGRRSGTTYLYRCVCACGETVHVSAEQLLVREQLGIGCMLPVCSLEVSSSLKAWYDLEYAIALQHSHLLTNMRFDTCDSWGGLAYEGVRPSHTAKANFRRDVKYAITGRSGHWWISRGNPLLPYSASNLTIRHTPHPELFLQGEIGVSYGGEHYTIIELADAMGVDHEQAGILRGTHIDDEAFVDALTQV